MTAISMGGTPSAGFGRARQQQRPAAQARSERSVSPARRSHLRMTARGRAVLLTLVAGPLVIAALAFGLNAGGASGTTSATPLTKVTVVGGETLWGLAQQIAPQSDPRDVIADIMSVNQMSTADIAPGEQLYIPAQYEH